MKAIPVLLLTLFCQDQGRTKLYWWPASLFLPSTLLFPSLPPQMSPRSVYRWDATSSPAAWRKGTTSTLNAASSPTLYVIIHIASSVTLSFNKFWRSPWLCSLSYHKMACIDFLFFRLSVFIIRIIFSLLPLFRCLHCAFNYLMPLTFTLTCWSLYIFFAYVFPMVRFLPLFHPSVLIPCIFFLFSLLCVPLLLLFPSAYMPRQPSHAYTMLIRSLRCINFFSCLSSPPFQISIANIILQQ